MKRSFLMFSPVTLLGMLAFSGIHFNSYSQAKETDRLVHVIFRYDDYSANSVTVAELKIIETFRKHGIPITFGVIPFKVAGDVHDPSVQNLLPLDSVKGEILKTGYEEGIIDISMHGYSHQSNSSEYLSEFANLEYQEQLMRLSAGKAYLENLTGAKVTTFLPPWNTYDLNTLSALEESGFSTISANKKGLVSKSSNLSYLPVSCGLTELKDAVKAARNSTDMQPLVVALLHDYDFLEFNDVTGLLTFQEFFDLIDWVSAQGDVNILSIGQASEVIEDLSAGRAIRTKHIYYPEKIPPLSWGDSMLLYQESPSLAVAIITMGAFYSIFLILGGLLFFRVRKKLFGKTS
jgi:peptidoglycan/xylan/chitin deacetylase (PgdA/CDA1 family)